MDPASSHHLPKAPGGSWWLVPAFAMLPLLAGTLTAWAWARARAARAEGIHFQGSALGVEHALLNHMDRYGDAVRGTQGLLQAYGSLSQEEWRRYAQALHAKERYPGIRSLQFAPRVPPMAVEAYDRSQASAGGRRLWSLKGGLDGPLPEAEAYFPIALQEPEEPLARSFDVASRPGVWAEVLKPAAESGALALGPREALLDGSKGNGFVLYGPVYAVEMPTTTSAQRLAALRGFVGCLFTPEVLFQDLDPGGRGELELEVYDGETPSAENLIFTADGRRRALGQGPSGAHERLERLKIHGRTWTLFVRSTAAWKDEHTSEAAGVLAAGLLISGATFAVLAALARGRARAVKLAESMTEELRAANRTLLDLATTDPLTGLLNRRAMETRTTEEEARSIREGQPLAVVLVDVDFFKHVNDKYGHEMGDVVLRNLAGILRQHTRATDHAARVGGEEFLLLLSNTDEEGAVALAENLRRRFQAFEHRSGELRISATASFGVAVAAAGGPVEVNRLQRQADKALYAAKANGRNRVELHQPMVIPEGGEDETA